MLVPSDTSPICNLAIIGRLQLLRSQFGETWIPGAVKCELGQLHHADALKEIQQAFQEGWIKTKMLKRAGLRAIGVLGVLLRAKKSGQTESIGRELDALRTRARFFLSATLTASVLKAAGE